MKTEQVRWLDGSWTGESTLSGAQLVLAFGSRRAIRSAGPGEEAKRRYPGAILFGCSTAGEIDGTQVRDESVVLTAIKLEKSTCEPAFTNLETPEDSYSAGARLAGSLSHIGLRHVLVLSDGLKVNGSELTRGLREALPTGVSLTGGLAGDGADFNETKVLCNHRLDACRVGVVGLYGDQLQIGYGSLGGWDPYGPDRLITRSRGNVLFELDGQSALTLYKNYLGEHASGLPATGLLFPLSLKLPDTEERVVRTILAVDEKQESITFAGDVPEGLKANFMKTDFDSLIDGAHAAAVTSCSSLRGSRPDLAILISCVGRKLVLKERIADEVVAVREVVGDQATLTGFYSYGEISPFVPHARCELHNQTMTITTLKE